MRKTEKPECESFGNATNITDDSIRLNLCQINGKRLDGYWGSWSVTYEEGVDYRMQIRDGICYQAHGGFECPKMGFRTRKVEIMRTVQTFPGAVEVCADTGGQLFDDVVDVDGFLQFLRAEIPVVQFWVVHPQDLGVYRNMAGDDVTSQILWSPSENGDSSTRLI